MFPSPLSPSFIKSSICLPLQSACTTHFPRAASARAHSNAFLARAYALKRMGKEKKTHTHFVHAKKKKKKQRCFDTSKCRDAHTYIYFVSSCHMHTHTHTHTDVHVHTHTHTLTDAEAVCLGLRQADRAAPWPAVALSGLNQ